MDIPKPFKMEGVKRIDDTPQHKAVREAFTNAIIHADLFLEGGVLRVEKHDDKLCLRNPGTLMLTIDQIYSGGVSRARKSSYAEYIENDWIWRKPRFWFSEDSQGLV